MVLHLFVCQNYNRRIWGKVPSAVKAACITPAVKFVDI